MIEATSEASKAIDDPVYEPRYNYAALILHGSNGEEHIIKMPYFSNHAGHYFKTEMTGGVNSQVFKSGVGNHINHGYPEDYFDIAENNPGLLLAIAIIVLCIKWTIFIIITCTAIFWIVWCFIITALMTSYLAF